MKLFKKSDAPRDPRRFRYGTLSTVLTAVVVVVFVLLNVFADTLADKYPLTWDLTTSGDYTLSDECKDVAETITSDVEIVLFFDENDTAALCEYIYANTTEVYLDLSEEFTRFARNLKTTLAQLEDASNGKITYTFLDPNQNPSKFAAYEKHDVTTGHILFISEDRYKISSIATLFSVDESSYTTSGTYYFNSYVEKELASKVYAVQNERIVQVLVGHQEDQTALSNLQALYELNGYTFETIDITGSGKFNEKAELMLIAAPTTDYSDAEVKKVQDWVFNKGSYGHNLIVFTDPTASCPNLYELLEVEYGITVTDELIWETDENRIFDGNHFYTKSDVLSTDYTKYSATAQSNKYLFAPIARRLTTSWPSEKEQENTLANLGIALNKYDTANVVKLSDYLNSKDSNDPQKLDENEYPLTSAIAAFIDSYDNNTQEVAQGTVIVCGCPSITDSSYIQNNSFSNEKFLMDLIDALAGVEDDVTISSKYYDYEYLSYEQSAQDTMLYIFVVGVPGVVLVVCLIVFLRRKYL